MPSGQNPWNELLKTKRPKAKGSLQALQVKLWRGIRAAELGLNGAMEAENGEDVRKWLHVLQQLSGVYLRIVLDGELEARLKVLEEKLSAIG